MEPDNQNGEKGYWQSDDTDTDTTSPELENSEPTEEAPAPERDDSVESSEPDTSESDDITPDDEPASAEPNPEQDPAPDEPEDALVDWQASEYIVGEKNTLWFLGLGIFAAALIALAIFTKAWTFLVLIVVAVVALIVYILRPAPKVTYALTDHGVHIGERSYLYSDFKSFGYLKDGEHNSIMLIPKKRFAPSMMIYFPEEHGEAIVDVFGARLPMQDVKLDLIDRIIRGLKI